MLTERRRCNKVALEHMRLHQTNGRCPGERSEVAYSCGVTSTNANSTTQQHASCCTTVLKVEPGWVVSRRSRVALVAAEGVIPRNCERAAAVSNDFALKLTLVSPSRAGPTRLTSIRACRGWMVRHNTACLCNSGSCRCLVFYDLCTHWRLDPEAMRREAYTNAENESWAYKM